MGMYILLIVIILLLIYYILKTKREVKHISNQIYENKDEYINIRTNSVGNDIEELVIRINSLYDENQNIKSKNKSIEEELRRSIANISHDLRTPLTSIMGYMQLLKSDNCTEEEKKEFIKIIERRTKNLQSLISSFYDLSRLESNEYKFNLKKVNLNKVLCDNIATYYNDFIKENIEPIIEIEEGNTEIISDEMAINRVFSNLIGNMLKHGNGEIKIRLKEEEKFIVSEFINDAPDLEEEDLKRLFERFYTADKSRSDKNTGLGLSITKAFVEELGNKINAELENGKLKIKIKWVKI